MTAIPALLSVQRLKKSFSTGRGVLAAVDDVSFSLAAGETLAIVGESGCGKSTLAMLLLGLATADSGTLAIDSQPLRHRDHRRPFGAVFQNPQSSLNPRMTVRAILAEPLTTAFGYRGKALSDRVADLLTQVGLGIEHLDRYPHEISGGQMQRIAIARALALEPRLLILDEPTAALDVSVGAQIQHLLKKLLRRHMIGCLLITHDLGAVDYLADRILVMYLGRIVESGPVAAVLEHPRHPYTRALRDAMPTTDPSRRGRFAPLDAPPSCGLPRSSGCAFAPRCRRATASCLTADPPLTPAEGARAHACHHPLTAD